MHRHFSHTSADSASPMSEEKPLSLEMWLHAQESAGIICSLCGLNMDQSTHQPDSLQAGQFVCGLAIPLEILAR